MFRHLHILLFKKAFAVAHEGVLFLSRCYQEAFKCSKNPATYIGAERELSYSDHYDDLNSDDLVCAVDLLHSEDGSELEEVQCLPVPA